MEEVICCPKCSERNRISRTNCKICGFKLREDEVPAIAKSTKDETLVISANQEGIIIKDIQMPFGSMIVFMVKWALASIPAFIIISVIIAICLSVFTGLLAGLGSH